jgi:hydrogenase maturation protease
MTAAQSLAVLGGVAPVLVLGWGNPSRGDDALGPMFVERLEAFAQASMPVGAVECLTDFQLQIEHALDLVGRERVLLVDASLDLTVPFQVSAPCAARDASFTTHALAPQALLQVYRDVQAGEPPPCTLLAIRATRFELGEAPGAQALVDLEQALAWAQRWLVSARNAEREVA